MSELSKRVLYWMDCQRACMRDPSRAEVVLAMLDRVSAEDPCARIELRSRRGAIVVSVDLATTISVVITVNGQKLPLTEESFQRIRGVVAQDYRILWVI